MENSDVPSRSHREVRAAPHARQVLVCPSKVSSPEALDMFVGVDICLDRSCATTGEGLFEGLQWLSQNVKKRQQ